MTVQEFAKLTETKIRKPIKQKENHIPEVVIFKKDGVWIEKKI